MRQQPTSRAAGRRRTRLAHPVDAANANLPPELARSRYGRWRALSLGLVYALMMVHIAHWKMSGRTMAPLELSEIMKALELRVLSPGVIFIGVMLLGSAIFGRYFCSWGCHMLALQDLSHWVLKRLRIRPRPIRSRVLLLVPFLAAGYMFLYPQIKRIWQGHDLPEASARLVTTNFWRDLPGPLVITLTFLTCGFLIVYFFGGRGFCTYGCPYGVLFGLLDRIAPGRIRVGPGCEQCGRCTAICTSNVRVHEEVKAYGMVVNPRCMKDLDCVSVCPQNVLHYRFGLPSLMRSRKERPPAPRYDFSIPEETALVVVFALALFTWRGLYGKLPFLMSLALSAITAYVAVALGRLFYRPWLTWKGHALKRDGRLLGAGYVFAGISSLFMAFALHSAFIQYHTWRGDVLIAAAKDPAARGPAHRQQRRRWLEQAVEHLNMCDRYGLFRTASLQMDLGSALLDLNRPAEAEPHLRWTVLHRPTEPQARINLAAALTRRGALPEAADHLAYATQIRSPHEEYDAHFRHLRAVAHVRLGELLARQERFAAADQHYRQAATLEPDSAEAHFGLGVTASHQGRLHQAVQHYRRAVALNPEAAEAYANLGDVLVALNEPTPAVEAYRSALAAAPRIEGVHFKIGVLSLSLSRLDDAIAHLAAAVDRRPDDPQARDYYGQALERAGRPGDARRQYETAVALDDRAADAHFNLGRLCALSGDRAAAAYHFQRAAELDPRFAPVQQSPPDAGR